MVKIKIYIIPILIGVVPNRAPGALVTFGVTLHALRAHVAALTHCIGVQVIRVLALLAHKPVVAA